MFKGVLLFVLGMDEVGIYRLSGATSEVRRLKDAFDNSKYTVEVNILSITY